MNDTQIHTKMALYSGDTTLSNDQKNIRIEILNIMLQKNQFYVKYNESLQKYSEQAKELQNLTSGEYRVEKSFNLNKISLKGYILKSEVCEMLKQKDIKNYDLDTLKGYVGQYSNTYKKDVTTIEKAISLYELTNEIENYVEKEYDSISDNLAKIVGLDVMSKYIEKTEDFESLKIREELKIDHQRALQRIDGLYAKKLFDDEMKEYAIQMINEVFDYRINGNV